MYIEQLFKQQKQYNVSMIQHHDRIHNSAVGNKISLINNILF